eukprot:m.25691 g.25691  ORF g.25691 m.25691 type:complete len:326 (+) comp5790_c0_seq1:321-1298(+)
MSKPQLKDHEWALVEEEVTTLKDEEKEFFDGIMKALPEEQSSKMTPLDYLTVIRGYHTYEPRMEETIKAAHKIADWREHVDYYNFLKKRLDQDEEFHNYWKEDIYGEDAFGHPIIAMHVNDVDTDSLHKMDDDHMLKLQGQKQTLYLKLKEDISTRRSEQRYKYILIVDLKGTGMGILGGKKRGMLQKIFNVGADNFPESIWKIFVVNTPFIFRTVWSVVKPWIDPITQAKINLHGNVKDCVKKMHEAGISDDNIPEFMGGTCKPKRAFDYLLEVIANNEKSATTATTATSTSTTETESNKNDNDNDDDDEDEDIAEDVGQLHFV